MKPFFGSRQFMDSCESRMAEFIREYCPALSRIDILDKGMNIPMEIVWLTRAISAGLPRGPIDKDDDQRTWLGDQFFARINLSGDASLWWPRFALHLLTDPDHGLRRHLDDTEILDASVSLFNGRGAAHEWEKLISHDFYIYSPYDTTSFTPGALASGALSAVIMVNAKSPAPYVHIASRLAADADAGDDIY